MNDEIQEAYAAGYDDGFSVGYNAALKDRRVDLFPAIPAYQIGGFMMKDNLQFHADYDDSQIIQHLAFSKGGSWHTGSTEIRNVFGDFIITKQLQIIPVSVLSDLQIAELAPRRKVPAKKVMLAVCRSAGVMK